MNLPQPLIPGFHPDPSIVRVGDDFYIATSTFEYLPGIPIHHSRDLQHWEVIGHVITRREQLQVDGVDTSGGVWAPTIRERSGRFYVVVTDAMGRGTLVFTADHPAGPWDDGVVLDVNGIDPDLAWADDGTAIVTFSGLQFDPHVHLGIQQACVDLSTGARLGDVASIWSGTGLMFPEAPHLYRIGEWWYLMLAEGGTERGHTVSVARSRSPYGPFEGCPSNPVLSARSTDRPIQNTGHADLFQAVDGSWHLVLLGMRVLGLTRSFSALGRETFSTPVEWVDGWPMPAPVILPPDVNAPVTADDFTGQGFGPEWLGIRSLPSDVATLSSDGAVLRGVGRTMEHPAPTCLARRVQRVDSRIAATVEVGGTGGLCVRYDEQHHIEVEVDGEALVGRLCLPTIRQERRVEFGGGPVTLVIESRNPGTADLQSRMTNDVLHLSAELPNGTVIRLGAYDGRYLTAETACSFTGRVAGVYCVDGKVVLREYRESASAM